MSIFVSLLASLNAVETFAQEPMKAPSFAIVKTWQDLRKQPAIDLGDGVKVRLGIEADRAPRFSGILVYCLAEGAEPKNSDDDDPLGPVSVDFHIIRDGPPLKDMRKKLSELKIKRDWPTGSYLYVRGLTFAEVGRYRLTIKGPKGKVLGQTILEGTKDFFHPWRPLDLAEDIVNAAPARVPLQGVALPSTGSILPIAIIPEGKTRTGKLPTFLPERQALTLRRVGNDIVIRSEKEFITSHRYYHWLARWWVNSKPYVPAQPDEFGGMDLSGFVHQGKELRLPLIVLPATLGAKPGDKIGLQVMYCDSGWQWCTNRGELAAKMAALEDDHEAIRVSNRIDFVPEMSNVGKFINASLAEDPVWNSLEKNPLRRVDMGTALEYIQTNKDRSAYHLLMALRKYWPATYREISREDRAQVLCDLLVRQRNLNEWGYLDPKDSYDADSAKALLEVGKPAVPFLTPILDDASAAPLFGSEAATMSHVYKYRRKDFAYRYLCLILNRAHAFSRAARDRDRDIEALKKELANAR